MQQNFPMEAQAAMGLICIVLGVVVAVALVVLVFYLLTLQKALGRVSPHHRLMEPGMVWLMLVPCVNFIWQFMIAIRVPDSLKNEFKARGRDDGSDYGKSIALTQAVLGIVSSVIGNGLGQVQDMQLIANGISLLLSLVGMVLFIMFWIKIANYSNQLAMDDGYPRDFDRRLDDFDDDDDRDRPTGGASAPKPETYREGDPGGYK